MKQNFLQEYCVCQYFFPSFQFFFSPNIILKATLASSFPHLLFSVLYNVFATHSLLTVVLLSVPGTSNIPVDCWILSHCIGGTDTPWFLYSFNCWHCGYNLFVATRGEVAVYLCVQICMNLNIPYTHHVFIRLQSLFFRAVGPLCILTSGTWGLQSFCLLGVLAVTRF